MSSAPIIRLARNVDGGDYALIDSDTLSFPTSSIEFGYGGDILVNFTIDDGIATSNVSIPGSCDAGRPDLSARFHDGAGGTVRALARAHQTYR